MKRFIIIGLAVLLFGGFFYYRRVSATETEKSITTATAENRDFVKTISSSGKTVSDRSVALRFQTSGRLAWVAVKEGDTVKAFQAIAGLDVREVRKNLEKALRDYSGERNDFEETWRVTYRESKPTDALTDTVKRILEKNQWDLEQAVLDVELKNLAVEYATLVTPIAGIVTSLDTPVAGVNITPAGAVFEISDLENSIFEAKVDEVDVGSIEVGKTAVISLDAYPDSTFSGSISYISYVSELSSGGATVFPVKIRFNVPDNMRIGLNGDVLIEVARRNNVLTIPVEAIREETGGKYVYKKNGKSFVKTAVVTGPKNETDIVIASGLSRGDAVVTKGFSNIGK